MYGLTRGGRLGHGKKHDREAMVLNRAVRWTVAGLEYENDQRQVERLLSEAEIAGEKVNGSAAPGGKVLAPQVAYEQELPPEMQAPYRASAVRANLVAAKRPDCLFAAKEVCKFTLKPTTLALIALKSLCRYLRSRQRLVLRYDYRRATHTDTFSDADHAGCVCGPGSLPRGMPDGGPTHHQDVDGHPGMRRPELWRGRVQRRGQGVGDCTWAQVAPQGRQGLRKLRHSECHT